MALADKSPSRDQIASEKCSTLTEFNKFWAWDSAGTSTLVGFPTTITALMWYGCALQTSLFLFFSTQRIPIIACGGGDQRYI
jgi:hypothetical protein